MEKISKLLFLLVCFMLFDRAIADIDHRFSIAADLSQFQISVTKAEEITWERFKYHHPRIIYNETDDQFLYSYINLKPNKALTDTDFQAIADVHIRSAPIFNDDKRFFWSMTVYARFFPEQADYVTYHLIYAVLIDAKTGGIAEESINMTDVVEHWKKQFGNTFFWSFETHELYDKLYPDYYPKTSQHICPNDEMIKPDQAIRMIHEYLTDKCSIDPEDYYTSESLISDFDESVQAYTIRYYIWLIPNGYFDMNSKAIKPEYRYKRDKCYYCIVDAKSGQLESIEYIENDFHSITLFP